VSTPGPLRLALDQNFPTPLINAVRGYLPVDIEVLSLREIDPRLSDLDDRPLFIAPHQLGDRVRREVEGDAHASVPPAR